MRWDVRRLLALTLLLGMACSSGGSRSNDGGGGSGGGPKTCVEVLRCAFEGSCADDACLTACKQGAGSQEAAAFDAVEACTRTMGGCQRGTGEYMSCMCLAQCLQDPPCSAEMDTCLAGTVNDTVCGICH